MLTVSWSFLVFACVIIHIIMQDTSHAAQTIEIRVDKLNAQGYIPPLMTCCFTNQCTCFSKIHACVLEHNHQTCPPPGFHTGRKMGGLAIGRTPSVLFLNSTQSHTKKKLALMVQIVFAPDTGQPVIEEVSVLGQYLLDISVLPTGPNKDQTGWTDYAMDADQYVTTTIQVKMYCSLGYFGHECLRKCVPVLNQFFCTADGTKKCLGLWTGEECDNEDPCESFPCLNSGTCLSDGLSFTCVCDPLYTGHDCSTGINSCDSQPCHQSATCVDLLNGYRCMCTFDRTGTFCEEEINDCRTHGCQNNGYCVVSNTSPDIYGCVCQEGFMGDYCQNTVCPAGICQNGGTCFITGSNAYRCDCTYEYRGRHCEVKIQNSSLICHSNVCKNGGLCSTHVRGKLVCQCDKGYMGERCEIVNPCSSSPCGDNGACQIVSSRGDFKCECDTPFVGRFCQRVVDPCLSNPCRNFGRCLAGLSDDGDTLFSYNGNSVISGNRDSFFSRNLYPESNDHINTTFSCHCRNGFLGQLCEFAHPCSSNPCKNEGNCSVTWTNNDLDGPSTPIFVCKCRNGYSGKMCDVYNACVSNPCQNGGRCVTARYAVNPIDGYICECALGYKGRDCSNSVSPCYSNPCRYGASCIESSINSNHYDCICQTGFIYTINGCERIIITNTSTVPFQCSSNPCQFGTCLPVGKTSYKCACAAGYTGTDCSIPISGDVLLCGKLSCQNGGFCKVTNSTAVCVCAGGFIGTLCQTHDPCTSSPCHNEGTCTSWLLSSSQLEPSLDSIGTVKEYHNGYTCVCQPGFTGTECEYETGITPINTSCLITFCLNNGDCITSGSGDVTETWRNAKTDTPRCRCLPGYVGNFCEKQLSCFQHHCENDGICIRTVTIDNAGTNTNVNTKSRQILTSCRCRPGFRGGFCEIFAGCDAGFCTNNGVCAIGYNGRPVCRCTVGFGGKRCQTRLSCAGVSCLNNGVCQVGFSGLFGGAAVPSRCVCRPGFTGPRCERRLNLFITTPGWCSSIRKCQYDSRNRNSSGPCVQLLQDGALVCRRCLSGRSAPTCEVRDGGHNGRINSETCAFNPCLNGGRCLRDEVTQRTKCACPRYYTGTTCSTLTNPCSNQNACMNGGACVRDRRETTPTFKCRCPIGYTGDRCQTINFDPCVPNPCQSGGKCSKQMNNSRGFLCRCPPEYTGDKCETLTERGCLSIPCKNAGTCVETSGGTQCQCLRGWTGRSCHIWSGRTGICQSDRCSGRGVCYVGTNNKPACQCHRGFGVRCEHSCGTQPMETFPHPTECSKYVMCVWGAPYVMNCPKQGLHYNPRIGLCDWSSRAGCTTGTGKEVDDGGGVNGGGANGSGGGDSGTNGNGNRGHGRRDSRSMKYEGVWWKIVP